MPAAADPPKREQRDRSPNGQRRVHISFRAAEAARDACEARAAIENPGNKSAWYARAIAYALANMPADYDPRKPR